uniref:Uncharacterized protein n=1 Tax=Magallana gigas TaxID=29159 RepID=K1PNZ0_MAGGI
MHRIKAKLKTSRKAETKVKILYRLLRADEDPAKGLTAKDPNSVVTVDSHVSYGSYGSDSRYISCSKTLEGINEFASHSKTFPRRIGYVYRLLRNDENPEMGLMAKNIWSKVSVQEHVAFGSHGVASRYISCCKSEAAVQRLAFLSRTNPKRIALLKVGLVFSNMKIIDLTDPLLIIPKDVSSLCLTWTSSADDIIRSHCYWYVELSKAVSFFEADDICASNGGRLAPFVDSWQYSIIENMRPYTTPDTFIGVIDIGKENTWTQLDGTKIDSSFTNTFDLNNNQPNGGKSQNCIVMDMEPHHYFRPDKTQDKSCFSSFKTTAMICYADKKEFCYIWMSVNDGKLREHCYWLTTKPRSSSRWNFIDALSRCTAEGGTLAPAIDEMQLAFIRETLTGIFQYGF